MGSRRRWLWWLVPLGALFCALVMGLLVARSLAAEAEDGTLAALDGAGLGTSVDFVGVDGFDGMGRDGLNVTVEGPASAESAAIAAVEERSGIDRVSYRVTDDDTAASEVEEEPAPAVEAEDDPAPAVGLDPAVVSATVSAEGIALEGTVPDDATREALIATAVDEFGAANVTHEIDSDPENIMADGGSITLTGQAPSDAERQQWLASGTAVATAANLAVIDEISLKPVEESLNELFTLEPIEFDVNQATIRSRSEPTLDAAAEMINANPDVGRLRVVGHTDSDGSASINRQLSEARAAAVVTYLVDTGGVDADRLEAEGRGESELLVDPETSPEDKQRNRRIEWELIS